MGEAIAFNITLSNFDQKSHEVIGYILSTLLALHILAALKPHLIDKDNTLKRMLGIQ
jgi:cytochrome b561